ncbi:MAG TPA: SRPBCC family protein [Chloroflexota bacterium]|jgi:uncharacterized protein YndB with AHSA1/START domain
MTKPNANANGSITIDGDQATLTFVRRLRYPIDRVWSALTEPSERKAWFGTTSLEPRQGGTIELDPDDPPVKPELKHMRGRILSWDPPRLLEHTWQQTIVGDGVVRYELAQDGDETILTFSHRGLSVPNARGFIPGTHAYFDRLAAHLDGQPIPSWSDRYAELVPAYT